MLPEFDSFELDKLTTSLRDTGGRNLVAKAVISIATLGGLTIADLQAFSETAPPFAQARWNKVAPKFGLNVDRDIYQLETFSVPSLSLPPSFHRKVMQDSAQWLDVYQETGSHTREAARVRLMDAVRCNILTIQSTLIYPPSGMYPSVLYSRAAL